MSTPFGVYLQTLRNRRGYTQTTLAEATSIPGTPGISRGYLNKLEHQHRLPKWKTVQRLIDAFTALGSALRPEEQRALKEAFMSSQQGDPMLPQDALSEDDFVGRKQERDVVTRWLQQENLPIFLLTGEMGVGKTRILEEAQYWGEENGWLVIWGRWLADRQEGFAPVIAAVTESLEMAASRLSRQTWAMTQPLARLFPQTFIETGKWSSPTDTHEDSTQAAAMEALLRALLDDERGVLLCLDDIQWAATEVTSFLDRLVAQSDQRSKKNKWKAPIHVIATYRDDELPENAPIRAHIQKWTRSIKRYTVRPLTLEASRTYLEHHLARPYHIYIDSLLSLPDQIPLFLKAVAQWVNDNGYSPELPIPEQLRDIFLSQVATLPSVTQQSIYLASVIGNEFAVVDLSAVVSETPADVERALHEVRRRGLITEMNTPLMGSYRFAHELVRRTLYESLSQFQRREWHLSFALALEREQSLRLRAVELAAHWISAGEAERAFPHLLQAGSDSMLVFAYETAALYFRQAVHIAKESHNTEQQAKACEHLGAALRWLQQAPEAITTLETSVHLYHLQHDAVGIGRIIPILGRAYLLNQEKAAALQRIQELLAQEGDAIPTDLQCRARMEAIYILLGSHRYDQAEHELQLVQALAETTDDSHLLGQVKVLWGWLLDERFQPQASLHILHEALNHLEQAGDRDGTFQIRMNMQYLYLIQGELNHARASSDHVVRLAQPMNNYSMQGIGRFMQGEVAFYEGHWEYAEQVLQESIVICEQLQMMAMYHMGRFFLARIHRAQGKAELAQTVFAETLQQLERDLWRKQLIHMEYAEDEILRGDARGAQRRLQRLLDQGEGSEINLLWSRLYLPWAAIALGDPAAKEMVEEQIMRLTAHGNKLWLMDASRLRGWLAIRDGDSEGNALSTLQGLLRQSRLMGYPYAEIKTDYVLGLLLQSQGAHAQAQETFMEGLGVCERLGEQYYAGFIVQALANHH